MTQLPTPEQFIETDRPRVIPIQDRSRTAQREAIREQRVTKDGGLDRLLKAATRLVRLRQRQLTAARWVLDDLLVRKMRGENLW